MNLWIDFSLVNCPVSLVFLKVFKDLHLLPLLPFVCGVGPRPVFSVSASMPREFTLEAE